MKRIASTLLFALILVQMICPGMFVSMAESYYTDIPTIHGETSRTVSYIYDGVTRTDFVLGTSSKYSNHGGEQRFSTLEFDPKQDDLYLSVTGGSYIHSQVKPSAAITNYNNAHASEGKTAIAATNGDLWLMVNNRVFTSGANQNATKGYIVPMGFAMYGGELICTNDLSTGGSWSFGIADDDTPLIGYLSADIKVTNKSKQITVTADGINRIPENNKFVVYTDKGYKTNHSMNDAYEVVIDCDYDYTVKAGATITGTVVAITKPGDAKYDCTENRIVLTARGTKKDLLVSFAVGHSVSVKVDIKDAQGNTDKWYTVTDCVSGHFPHVINGVAQNWGTGQAVNYPSTVVGIKKDGNVVLFTSYGRQVSTYSEGIWIMELPELLVEMGVENAFMLDGGGSTAMITESAAGGYELTGKPSDNKSFTLGTERSVVNNIILAVGPSKSGIDSTDANLGDKRNTLFPENNNTFVDAVTGATALLAANEANPYVKYDILGDISASDYKYAVIEARTTLRGNDSFTMGVYPSFGRGMEPSMASGEKIVFDSDGLWQRQMVDFSGMTMSGRLNFLRLDLFDDTGVGIVGEGVYINGVRLFRSATAARSYASKVSSFGDADGNGKLNVSDVSLIMKKVAGWDVEVNSLADYDCSGSINLADAAYVLRVVAS